MKKLFIAALILLCVCMAGRGQTEKPLRIFIRAGVKTHGPGQHDHPRFLKEWTELLNQRGAQATGGMDFPTAEQLGAADVLILYAGDAGDIKPEQRTYLDEFLKRGGGIVVIHDGICGHDPDWFKTIVGGAWNYGHTKYFEGALSFYYLNHDHPITRGVSNFDFDDEQYYDMDLLPEANILAGTYQPDDRNKHDGRAMPSVYDVAPQMWTYEKDNHRAFVSIPGHNYKTFNLPNYRAVLLRGIAWVGKREVDSLVSKEELASLRYPVGGPTAPDEAVKKLVVPPDFNISLVAAEPLIEKPISMDWDPQGRLWIAETPEYPFRKDRSRAPYDRISILESTHGDGHMDKKTVFCDDLDLVTSLVFYKDGVIVSQAPYIYWLRDTHGSGKADTKTALYKGFGTNDTHAVVSNLRWGMDGWIYATVGYSKGDIYSGDGKTHFGPITEGVIRFRPEGTAIEQVCSKGGNTWGMDFGPDGEIFFTQANGSHIDHVVMPESALARGRVDKATSYLLIEDHNKTYPLMNWTKQAYVQIDWVGNFTAAAGCCIYDGGAWPDKYNYTHYVSEPTVNLVHQDFITPKGVTYVASKDPERLEKEFVVSTDLWFRPIHQRVGPDGALYILDFYNQAVVHNDTRGTRHDPLSNAAIRPDRDHYFGRIWRAQHNDAKKLDLPNLDVNNPAGLVTALKHPNEWVRMTALRLLLERGKTDVVPQLFDLAKAADASSYARIHALWLLADLGEDQPDLLVSLIDSNDDTLKRAALQVAALVHIRTSLADAKLMRAISGQVSATNQRVRLQALITLQSTGVFDPAVPGLEASYLKFNDAWSQSAFLGIAANDPLQFITAALRASDPAPYQNLTGQLATQIAEKKDAAEDAKLVISIANEPASVDGLKQEILEKLERELKPETVPPASPELSKALQSLLSSTNEDIATLALPLAARWDRSGALANDVNALVKKLAAKLTDSTQPDSRRLQLARSLLAVRQLDASILPSVASILGSDASPSLQRNIIEALGVEPDATVGQFLTQAYPKLPAEAQSAVLNTLFKRADWSLALLDAIEANKISLNSLGPVPINRLRTYGDKTVSDRANKIIDAARGPEVKEKDALIAKFTPIVVQPGNVAHGKELFTANCAVCHRFKGEGKDVAPDLTGMGAHGPAELIIHVLDPNREVEPNYYAYSIETTDGETYEGIIARENSRGITLRNSAGDMEIRKEDIRARHNTGRSLMPNGFEALGPEALRDILSYLCADAGNYRILDLRSAFNATSGRGLFLREDDTENTLHFKKYGLIKEGDVPFEIVNPQKSATGRNLVVLKGGSDLAHTLAQRVEITDVNVKAAKLHFLGGVGGWMYPWSGEKTKDLPAAKVIVHYASGQSEELVLKSGEEFADWNGSADVPGSRPAPDLVTHGQVRWFTKTLKHPDVIRSISLESYDNVVSPVFIAITAEVGDGTASSGGESAPATHATMKWRPGTKHVLIVGGGSSHDFNRWFNQADVATLAASGNNSVNYTADLGDVLPALADVDVLVWTSNQPLTDDTLQKGIFDFASAGHGLVLVHPGVWYNWNNWPEYNRVLVGGGAHGHDRLGEFEVTVKEPNHPIMAGIPAVFKITDELYHTEVDPKGTPVEVLAEAKSPLDGKVWPSVWIVKHPRARIACIALGHDGGAHDLLAYKTILKNAVKWAEER